MSTEVISILVLVAIFLVATVLPVHMGILGLVATFVVGTFVVDMEADALFAGFPGDLFVILVGVTYLFAIAKANGTVDWLVQASTRAVGGRIALIPWVMFFVTGVMTALGAVVPASVAIVAPIGLGFARRYNINPVLMGLLIINGAAAGGFSPLSVFGAIVNGVVDRNDLESNELLLWGMSIAFNFVLSVIVYFMFGGRKLLQESGRVTIVEEGEEHEAPDDHEVETATTLDRDRWLTIIGIVGLVVGAVGFDLDIGFMAVTVGGILSLASPEKTKGAVAEIAWPTVLLICGIVTYVSLLEEIGTVDYLGDAVADLGAPLLSALLICYIGAAVSAFASTTGILGALIPLAVPFLETGAVGAVGMIIALSLSSSIVDSSPFSTSGALVVANAADDTRELVYKRLLRWGFTMVLVIPPVTWLVLVVPGWL